METEFGAIRQQLAYRYHTFILCAGIPQRMGGSLELQKGDTTALDAVYAVASSVSHPSPSKKVKVSHTRYRALGPELIPVYRQSARR